MSGLPDVVVAGGGIVGLCTALAAADRHLNVTVVDDARPGASSRAAAGLLAPSLEGLPPTVRETADRARDMYPDLVAQLLDRTGITVRLDREGILELATSPQHLAAAQARTRGRGHALGQRELAELEPALARHAGAVHHPLDGAVDSVSLMEALWLATARHPRIEVVRRPVASVALASSHPCVVLMNGDRVAGKSLVLATGAWAGLPGTPRTVPVRPVKGELLTLDSVPVRHVVYSARGYLVPRGESVLVGATSEDVGFEAVPSHAGRMHLHETASAHVPGLGSARLIDHWAGLRPCSPDGLPLVGPDVEWPELFYACGFSRNGILLGPWAGAVLGALVAGVTTEELPTEFDQRRFAKK